MPIHIDDARRSALLGRLQGFWLEEFDEELSAFRAEQVLDFVGEAVGPAIYNQAVQDARHFMQVRLDDLEGEVWAPETG